MKLCKYISVVLLCLLSLIAVAQKPYIKKGERGSEKRWQIKWEDNFSNQNTLDKNWIAENMAPTHILSSRWRENIDVKKGKVLLCNRKEKRGGRIWTTGSMTCNKRFSYGYYECRLKMSDATGINNAFWLYNWKKTEVLHAFEIDILEGHYPNEINTTIHDRGNKTTEEIKTVTNIVEKEAYLTHDFHRYGLWWTEEFLRFYFDGRLTWEVPNTCCHQVANLVLGTSVLPGTGPVTDSIDGTSMEVDYVRVWKEKR